MAVAADLVKLGRLITFSTLSNRSDVAVERQKATRIQSQQDIQGQLRDTGVFCNKFEAARALFPRKTASGASFAAVNMEFFGEKDTSGFYGP
jgi:hypothetical protein